MSTELTGKLKEDNPHRLPENPPISKSQEYGRSAEPNIKPAYCAECQEPAYEEG